MTHILPIGSVFFKLTHFYLIKFSNLTHFFGSQFLLHMHISLYRPTYQYNKRWTNQQTNRPTDQQTYRPTDQHTNRPTHQHTNIKQMNRSTDQQTNRPIDKQTHRPFFTLNENNHPHMTPFNLIANYYIITIFHTHPFILVSYTHPL